MAAIQPWKEIIDKKGNEKIGVTKVRLKKQLCYLQECNLGNFIADSFIYYYLTTFSNRESLWNDSVIALVNAGGIRATINSGRKLILFGIIFIFILFYCNLSSLDSLQQ